MNHVRLARVALTAALTAPLCAQQQAATMASLAARADVVVRASVTYSVRPTPQWRQVGLRTDAVLKGQVGQTFTLTEPAGECCGRSLFSLRVGDERLLFLRRVGPVLHPDTAISQVVVHLTESRNNLPVVDEASGKLVGMVSYWDIIGRILGDK